MSAVLNISLHNGQVDHFHREWKDGTLVLNPAFQRSNMVWDLTRKSRLIESLIVGFPVPPIFLTDAEGHIREVVDGLQRMTAIFAFIDDEYELRDLEFTGKINGSKFSQLSETLQARVQRASLGFYVLPSDSKHWGGRLKHIVFNRLNQGVPVNLIERIMGSEPGPGNTLVTELAQDFLVMWESKPSRVKALKRRGKHLLYALTGLVSVQLSVKDDSLSMGDWEYRRGGKNPWEQLLLTTLRQLNRLDDTSRKDLRDAFREALTTVQAVYDHPFQGWDEERDRWSPSVKDAAIVAQMWGFSRPSNWTSDQWIQEAAKVQNAWKLHCGQQTITHQANTLYASLRAWGEVLDDISK